MFKNLLFVPLFALPLFAGLLSLSPKNQPEALSSSAVNLALRRTADALLREAGDSTSRIPAIEQTEENVWKVRIHQTFHYEQLPSLLQASLDLHQIQSPYTVAVRKCEDGTLDLGYHKIDMLQNKPVPCGGRELPNGCHFIEITFSENQPKKQFWVSNSWLLLLISVAWIGFWFFRKQKVKHLPQHSNPETDWVEFGKSRLDVAGQILLCAGKRQALTFRETKLLNLFASNPDKVLERDFILKKVWADEGILVGRSIDVFVSRLRKKLAADTTLAIVAIHGLGYRLETRKINN